MKTEVLKNYKYQILKIIQDNIDHLNIEGGIEETKQIAFLDTHIQLYNFTISQATFDMNDTYNEYHPESQTFKVVLSKLFLDFSFNYKIKTSPELFDDSGFAKGYFDGLSVEIEVKLYEKDGTIQLELKDVNSTIENIQFETEGGDISAIINYFSGIMIEFIKKYFLGEYLDQSLRENLQEIINQQFMLAPKYAQFGDSTLELDYSLVSPGLITNQDYFAILTDGTFHLVDEQHQDDNTRNFTDIPLHRPDGKLIQIFVSEYVLNTFIKGIIDLNWYQYNFVQNSDSVDAFIQGFEFAFGDIDVVNLEIHATNQYQDKKAQILINEKGSSIDLILEVHIKNPYDISMDCAVVILQVFANITFTVDENFALIGEVQDLGQKPLDFKAYFQTKTTLKDLGNKLNLGKNLLQGFINSYIDKGFPLPIPTEIGSFIFDEEVKAFDGYLMLQGNPYHYHPEQPKKIKILRDRMKNNYIKNNEFMQ